jgi:sugar lactone lactonase YvrE
MPGLLVGRRSGGLILGLEDGLYDFRSEAGLGERLVAIDENKPLNRLNDGKPDKAGRLWLGSMDKTGQFQPTGALYRVDTDRTVTCIRQPLRIPNGIDFSPCGTRMYFTDSHEGRIQEFDYDHATGMPSNGRDFLSVAAPVLPDGCCIDSEGALWIAMIGAGRIERRLADGSLHTVIELPVSRPTMPILGGPDGSTLFITTQRRLLDANSLAAEPLAGDLLAVRVDARARDVDRVAF